MYHPPLDPEFSSWEHRRSLLRQRIGLVNADVVCLQEVSPLSFERDFSFMADDLGYEGVELFRKGRFRPATFWKKDRVALMSSQHKDRTLLTSFRLLDGAPEGASDANDKCWHVLNCHLQAGKQGGRRVRQIGEGVAAAFKTAKNKLKGACFYRVVTPLLAEKNCKTKFLLSVGGMIEEHPENLNLIACGDFNGGEECGAVQFLETGCIGPDFVEDGERVSSKEKSLPILPLLDAISANGIDRGGLSAPPTLVVPELISLMVESGEGTAYANPQFSKGVIDRLHRIYSRFATVVRSESPPDPSTARQMGKADVERWLVAINLRVGRGTEFRNAARCMGWVEPPPQEEGSDSEPKKGEEKQRSPIVIPEDGTLTLEDFVGVYLEELRQGKFWGVAWDLAALGEPLPVKDVFRARYDRMYCSASLAPAAVLDTISNVACPNMSEPSDHLPVCASFVQKHE